MVPKTRAALAVALLGFALWSAPSSRALAQSTPGVWRFVGPDNIGGPIDALSVDSVNPSMVLAAMNGALWRSADAGVSWNSVAGSPTGFHITLLARHPTNSSMIFAASSRHSGLYRSDDNATSWQPTEGSAALVRTSSALALNADGSALLLLAGGSLLPSSDLGRSWPAYTVGVAGMASSPTDPRRVVATLNTFASIYRQAPAYVSNDGGITWSAVMSLLANATYGEEVRFSSIRFAPGSPQTVYAVATDGAIYRSQDGGTSFSQRRTAAPISRIDWVDPTNADVVLGTRNGVLYRSVDGGLTFVAVTDNTTSTMVEPHVVTSSPGDGGVSNRRVLVGSETGVSRTDDAVTVTTTGWIDSSRGLHGVSLSSVRATSGGRLLASVNGQLIRLALSGSTDAERLRSGVSTLAVDPTDRAFVYGSSVDGLLRSQDGGSTFTVVAGAPNGSIVAHDQLGFLSSSGSIYRTTNLRSPTPSWSVVHPMETTNGSTYSHGATEWSPATSVLWFMRALVGAPPSTGQFCCPIGLHRLVGADGSSPSVGASSVWGASRFHTLSTTAASADGQVKYVGDRVLAFSSIRRTNDGGATWASVSVPTTATGSALAMHPRNPDWVFAGTAAGVFQSTDGGATWTLDSAQPSETPAAPRVTDLTWYDRTLIATTSSGVWAHDLAGLPAVWIDGPPTGTKFTQPFTLRGSAIDRADGLGTGIDFVQVYAIPNPGSGRPAIFVGNATYGESRSEVASAYGSRFAPSGFSIAVRDLPSGPYQFIAYGRSTFNGQVTAGTLTTDVSGGVLSTDPMRLRFHAKLPGVFHSELVVTPPQDVTVTSTVLTPWTVTANQTWLRITGAAGGGNGRFTASIDNSGNVLTGSTTLTATITVTPAVGSIAPVTIPVTLTVDPDGPYAGAPFGQVDTPAQNATGVQGAMAVTGWALDDTGVRSVKVYRNCVPFDAPAACQGFRVYLGDAGFVPGARPDVEAAFPDVPQPYRAGWGMQILTNMLPNISAGAGYGGVGTFTLTVVATDVGQSQVVLGRVAISDNTPTTVTLANDSIAKPFGAIDTPAQGGTTSGQYANFGWVLTPDANTAADAGDILMTTTGAGMTVFIDGAPVGTVNYNHCRGTVGTPVPSGLFCDDDVANIFGQPTPRPVFTTRTANTTRFRNLDAARGAIGVFTINTTTLSNGMHNLAWGVTDSANRTEGIGSRNFFVLNSGADPPSPTQTSASARQVPHSAPSSGHPALSTAHPALSTEHRAQRALGRSGFSLATAFVEIAPDAAGERRVQIGQLDRVELQLGADVTAGHLVVNGTQRDLPVGSRLDTETGTFTWAPAAGFLGAYRFVFGCQGEACLAQDAVSITVTVRPTKPAPAGESEIRMRVDEPLVDSRSQFADSRRAVTITGEAFDPRAFTGSGIGAVHVWARRVDVPTVGPEFLGAATLGVERADVGAPGSGFRLTVPLAPGIYEVTVYAWNHRTARWEDARTTRVDARR